MGLSKFRGRTLRRRKGCLRAMEVNQMQKIPDELRLRVEITGQSERVCLRHFGLPGGIDP